MNWNDLLLRCRALAFRDRVEQDLEEELELHIAMQARKNLASGMTEAEAVRLARIEFGGTAQIKEECRDARRIGLIETTWQDVRYAVRGFRRAPVFVLTVTATIALGLGLNTALFTVFDATYFRPVPVRDPHSLYDLSWTDRAGAGHGFSWPEYQEFLSANPAFRDALAYRYTEARLDGRNLTGLLVTGGYFQMLGAGVAMGRMLLPEDSPAPGSEPVIVLSHSTWRNRFGSDPNIVGKKILLRGFAFEVVGVATAGFRGLGGRPADFWAPVTMAARLDSETDPFGVNHPRALSIVGRLRADFGVRQAQSGLTLWAQRFTASSLNREMAAQGILTSRATVKPFSLKNVLLFSPIVVAFGLVLLIGCANVANMLLARAMSRQREIGIRLSLGARRGRLIRQLLTESVLLALPAAAAGFAVAQATIAICMRVLLATLPQGVADVAARFPRLSPDARVLAFNLAAAVLSALWFGLAPAIQATRGGLAQAAKGELSAAHRPWRLRNALVVGQVTVCVLLLVTAGILLRGAGGMHALLNRLSARDTIEVVPQEKARARVLDWLSTDRDIEVLAAAANAPVDRSPGVAVQLAGGTGTFPMTVNSVSPEYFAMFEIPVVRGRNFTAGEARAGAPVAIISQAAAQRLWPNQDPLGRSFRLFSDRTSGAGFERYQAVSVVGIARDEISRWISSGEDPGQVYFPGNPQTAGNALLVRVHGDAEATRRRMEADLTAIDPEAIKETRRIQIREWVEEDAYYSVRVAYWLSSAIGGLALLLTLSGIYGVLSYVVSQRTKEIGIRMAMGATRRAVTVLVLKQSMSLGVIGTAVGTLLAAGVSKLLSSAIVMINTFDWVAYFGGILLVLAACGAAAYIPCHRASRIDPVTTLRYD